MRLNLFSREPFPEHLRICITAHRFPIQSRSTDTGLLWPVARGLAKAGHEVTVISSTSPLKKAEVNRDGVRAFFLYDEARKVPTQFQTAVRNQFLKLHKEKPFHLVHSLDKSGFKIASQKESLKIAVAYDVEATRMAQLFSILGMQQDSLSSLLKTYFRVITRFLTTYLSGDRQLLNTADGIFVTTPQQKQLLERYYLYPEHHTYNVPYGIELMDLTPREQSKELKLKWGLPENARVAVTILEMTDTQEVLPLLKAFEKVAIRLPYSYLFIIGQGPNQKQVEYEVLNLALGNRVFLTGAIDSSQMEEQITLADVFIHLGSRSNGFEPATLEAMAQKKVVIGSEVAPISNIIEDGRDGFLVRPADVDSIYNLLLEIFSDRMPIDQIGDRARDKIVELFNAQKMTALVIDAYKKILANSGRYKSP